MNLSNLFFSIALWSMTLSAIGQTSFLKTYGPSNIVEYWGLSVQQTSDGGYLLTGAIHADGAPGGIHGSRLGHFLVKTDAYGDTIWTHQVFSANPDDQSFDAVELVDGGYLLVHGVMAYCWIFFPESDLMLTRLDAQGNPIWQKKVVNSIGACGLKLEEILQNSKNEVVMGVYQVNKSLSFMGVDTSGVITNNYYPHYNNSVADLLTLSNDDLLMAENLNPHGAGAIVTKLDPNGQQKWRDTLLYPSPQKIWARKLIEADDHYLLLGSSSIYNSTTGQDVYSNMLTKVDTNGQMIWRRYYNESFEGGYQAYDSTYIMTGRDTSGSLIVYRLDTLGVISGHSLHGNTNFDNGVEIIEASDSTFVAIGTAYCCVGPTLPGKVLLIKESIPKLRPTSLDRAQIETFVSYFPNPGHHDLYIESDLPGPFFVKLMDIQGKLLLESEIQTEGKLSLRDLSPGVYLLQFNKGSKYQYSKLIVR